MSKFKLRMLLLILILVSCQDKTPFSEDIYLIKKFDPKTGETSLIEHPYIFEDMTLKIEKFTWRKKSNYYEIKLLLQGHVKELFEASRVFIHAYPNTDTKSFVNLDLNDQRLVSEHEIEYYGTFTQIPKRFEELVFGINSFKEDKRLFTLTLKDINF